MKIAMLSFRLPAAGVKRGGVERVAHDLANGLARHGHTVTVWSGDRRPPGAGYQVRPLAGGWLIHHWLGFRLLSGYLGNFLALLPDYGDAQVLIAHGDSLLLPLLRIPVLRIMHGSALDESLTARSIFRKALQFGVYLQELATARTQLTIGVSRNTQKRYRAIDEVIPNGVDTKQFFTGVAEKSTDPSILFVGTLSGRKRGGLLLDWFAEKIQPALPQAKLWMVSERGPDMEGVRYFTGASEAVLTRLYRHAWVLASPSLYEGFGLPYLEAMASGVPVVATANSGSREVLDHGRFGRLIEHDAEFAPTVLELLRDHHERSRWAERGLERSRDLSLEHTVEQYEAVLRKLAVETELVDIRA